MTVEEKAKETIKEFLGGTRRGTVPFVEWTSDLQRRIERLLRDQIEACAIVADETATDKRHTHSMNAVARLVGRRIRILAGPREEEVKSNDH